MKIKINVYRVILQTGILSLILGMLRIFEILDIPLWLVLIPTVICLVFFLFLLLGVETIEFGCGRYEK